MKDVVIADIVYSPNGMSWNQYKKEFERHKAHGTLHKLKGAKVNVHDGTAQFDKMRFVIGQED